MNEQTPESAVRDFCAHFGPTYDEMIATTKRLVHDDIHWESCTMDKPIENIDQLLADLERARDTMGVHAFSFDLPFVATTGNVVLMERVDRTHDATGAVTHELRVMAIICVEEGKFRWCREYFFDTRAFTTAWGDVNV